MPWLAGVVLALLTLGALEAFWRWNGHQPSIVDDLALWAYHRERVYGTGPPPIVLLGMSRMQIDVSTSTFRERLPGHGVVQLAVAGRHPIAALRDLSEDERFVGIAVCGLNPEGLLRSERDRQQEYVDFYHREWSADLKLNGLIRWSLQERLAVLGPHLTLLQVAGQLARHGRLPNPPHVTMNFDRSRVADFSLAEPRYRERFVRQVRRHYRSLPPPAPDVWIEEAMEIEPMVDRLQERGGSVAFVRFPTSDEHRELDEMHYPRSEYWDRFAARTSATTIHFEDAPGLDGYDLPDTSHLDSTDAPRFTDALIDELVRRRVIPVR